jgi:uncharacterized protein (UPF0305 family)
MSMNIDSATLMPGREQETAITAIVLHILERVHHVRDEEQAEGEAEDDEGPETVDQGNYQSAVLRVLTAQAWERCRDPDRKALEGNLKEEMVETHWVVFPT